HANTRGSELGGSRAHQLDGAGFCHGIDGLARFDDLRTYGRKQDDASGALLAHEATRGLNDVERTLEVEIENAIDLIRREFENRLSDVDAWGANHDIETPSIRDAARDRTPRSTPISDVELTAGRGAPDPRRDTLGCGVVDVQTDYRGTVFG